MNIRLLIVLVILSVTACTPGVRPGVETAPGTTGTGAAGTSGTQGGVQIGKLSGGVSTAGTALEGKTVSYEKNAINDPGNVLSIRTIYFAFDSSEISDVDVEVLKHHGKYLSLNTDAALRLEGHTDERGSREYNVALADRRAQSVKKLLLFQGASSDQIMIISYGEEKPAAFGHDESAWKMNRRVELVYE